MISEDIPGATLIRFIALDGGQIVADSVALAGLNPDAHGVPGEALTQIIVFQGDPATAPTFTTAGRVSLPPPPYDDRTREFAALALRAARTDFDLTDTEFDTLAEQILTASPTRGRG